MASKTKLELAKDYLEVLQSIADFEADPTRILTPEKLSLARDYLANLQAITKTAKWRLPEQPHEGGEIC